MNRSGDEGSQSSNFSHRSNLAFPQYRSYKNLVTISNGYFKLFAAVKYEFSHFDLFKRFLCFQVTHR